MINYQDQISLIPLASIWVEEQEKILLAKGIPLTEKQKNIASKIGIKNVAKNQIVASGINTRTKGICFK